MDDNSYNWGRWRFSSEAEARIMKLVRKDKPFSENRRNILETLILQIHEFNSKNLVDEEEYFTDSSLSTDVDDSSWEELKTLKMKSDLNENLMLPLEKLNIVENNSSNQTEEVNMGYRKGICRRINKLKDNNAKKSLDAAARNLLSFSQSQIMEVESENEDDDIVFSLKEALENEELDDSEIIRLLDSNEITEQNLILVWSEMDSCSARIRLCRNFPCEKTKTLFLCQKLLLPWLTNDKLDSADEIVKNISELLPRYPDIAIKSLVMPLIYSKESNVFMKDIYLLRDMMSSLDLHHWTLLLQGLLENLKVMKWHLPLLKLIIESLNDEGMKTNLSRILILLSSLLNEFAKDRDFGLLIIAVINKITKMKDVPETAIDQLKSVGENISGPMQFKIMNSIKQILKS